MALPLPNYLHAAPSQFAPASHNAGLWYDKFVSSWNDNWSRPEVRKLDWIKTVATKDAVGSSGQLKEHEARQQGLVNKLGGRALTLITATRFATGLGREHPVEIGFTWHHTLGTPYLPGSSVKGLLRAYVREWIGHETATELFGQEDFKKESRVGKWIFFDAVPTKPVQLEADVMTPHYKPYYQDAQGRTPPGDWHSPIPIPFLAVAREQSFQFAFAPRGNDSYKLPDGTPVTNDTIADWLRSALHWLGAGAKTNSGFGVFRDSDPAKAEAVGQERPRKGTPAEKSRRSFTATLELITPAFLAGADQNAPTDCDLRPATLRGQLRYWWRTMHAGYLTVEELRSLEAALWGSTNGAGAIRVVVQRTLKVSQSVAMPGKHVAKNKKDQDVLRLDPAFAKEHGLMSALAKRTQGFLYLSFGMDEMPAGKLGERKRRFCLSPGAEWEIAVICRKGQYSRPDARHDEKPTPIEEDIVEQQAKAALWLLCQYGGVGSKSRNAYGSLNLKTMGTPVIGEFEQVARKLRDHLKLSNDPHGSSETSDLNNKEHLEPIKTPWKNYWFVLDQLGFSIQDFCQKTGQKRTWVKEAFGLPRKVGQSENDGRTKFDFEGSTDKTGQSVVWLGQKHPHLGTRKAEDMRHASPFHLHISRSNDGTYSISAIAFVNRILPDEQTSGGELRALIAHLKTDLPKRIADHSSSKAAAKVRVKILAAHSLPNSFRVQEEGTDKRPGILQFGKPPATLPNVGETIEVYRHNDNPQSPQYRWDPPPPPNQQARSGSSLRRR